jgi:hypothetical protein
MAQYELDLKKSCLRLVSNGINQSASAMLRNKYLLTSLLHGAESFLRS